MPGSFVLLTLSPSLDNWYISSGSANVASSSRHRTSIAIYTTRKSKDQFSQCSSQCSSPPLLPSRPSLHRPTPSNHSRTILWTSAITPTQRPGPTLQHPTAQAIQRPRHTSARSFSTSSTTSTSPRMSSDPSTSTSP